MKRIYTLSFLVVLCLGGALYQGGALQMILETAVKGDRVDYALVRKSAAGLQWELDDMDRLRPKQMSREQSLALHINAYNATMLMAVIDHDIETWKPSDDDFAVFKEPRVKLMGQTMSLNDLENKVIRPTFKDPRIHAALNCAAISCPPLINRAYTADDLDAVLEANMKRFVNDPTRNPVDHDARTIYLSEIFKWYAPDFGGPDKLLDYVDRYHEADLTGYSVEFIPYDWSLNGIAAK